MNWVSILAACAALIACDKSSPTAPASSAPSNVGVGVPPSQMPQQMAQGQMPQNQVPQGQVPRGLPQGQIPQETPQGQNPPPSPNGGAPENYGAPPTGEYSDEEMTGAAPPTGPNAAAPVAPPQGGATTFDLKPLRTWDAVDPNASLTADGDYMAWKAHSRGGQTCGVLYKTTPYEAVFFLCGGSLIVGPLTDPEKIKQASAEMQQSIKSYFDTKASMSAFANNLRRSMQANWPSGCSTCRFRIYDQNGNYLRDEH